MRKLLLASLVLGIVCAAPVRAEDVTLTGTFENAKGKPIADADVATTWLEGKPSGGVRTDENGAFEIETRHYGRGLTLMALHEKRKLGAVAVLSANDLGEPVTLVAGKLVKVHGKLTCEELGSPPPWTNVYVNLMPGNMRVARYMSEEAEFSFLLPVGTFKLHMYGTDVRSFDQSIEIEEGSKRALDLGQIDLQATPIAKLYDKPLPPWTVTAARGLDDDVELSDFRGKWVLLEFWFST